MKELGMENNIKEHRSAFHIELNVIINLLIYN